MSSFIIIIIIIIIIIRLLYVNAIIQKMKKPGNDIDRGWAWLVLVAVYLGIITLSTTFFFGGVLYVALLEKYNADKAKTSLVGALNGGLLCLLG